MPGLSLPMCCEIPATETDRRDAGIDSAEGRGRTDSRDPRSRCRALRRIHLKRRQEQVQQDLRKPGLSSDRERLKALLSELERISRALRDPGWKAVLSQ